MNDARVQRTGWVAVFVLGLWILFANVGCSPIGYYAQSVRGQLDVLARREPISEKLASDTIEEPLKTRLREVLDVRRFATEQLALPDNDSYRLYADLRREAMVWAVVAPPEFSVEPLQWCYPVVGCAAYRGYFDRREAQDFALDLQVEGMGVTVNPVPAYSTLGWFDDPLPGSVMHWPTYRIAGLIFHELAHQRLYVQGDSAFNEAFATAVQRLGVERWLRSRGDEKMLAAWREEERRRQAFVKLLLDTRDRLERLYVADNPPQVMRWRKHTLFTRLRSRYRFLRKEWGGYRGYDEWFARPLNNARFASVATYEALVPAFLALARSAEGDMAEFYRRADMLGALSNAERAARLRSML